MWEEKLALYDKIVRMCPRFERKGKTVPYTSANGHMFSILNKDGEVGIRFSEGTKKKYLEKYKTTAFKSHGATMRGYTLITDKMLADLKLVVTLLDESYDYVMSLDHK
ncbi:MAG: hypothetical protein HKN76_08310 [Saprospiraceae bacterium]|nr:hypothetical protein [Saprospiraceae bacterium]